MALFNLMPPDFHPFGVHSVECCDAKGTFIWTIVSFAQSIASGGWLIYGQFFIVTAEFIDICMGWALIVSDLIAFKEGGYRSGNGGWVTHRFYQDNASRWQYFNMYDAFIPLPYFDNVLYRWRLSGLLQCEHPWLPLLKLMFKRTFWSMVEVPGLV